MARPGSPRAPGRSAKKRCIVKAIFEVETLQICTTSACVLECANCTHLVGHAKRPHMMSLEQFKKVVDSLEGYPKMIGMIGGEVLLSPFFADQARYLRSKFPREQLGLWSVFPKGEKYVKHREVICETFANILLNDHSVANIMHAPMLVAAGEYYKDKRDLHAAAWNCWVQNAWSPGVTVKGAFFCEVAGELDYLFEGPGGWDVSEPGWWKRTPADYASQIDFACSKCGGCLPLERRSSQDIRCDISEGNAALLKGKSSKVDKGQVVVHAQGKFPIDRGMVDPRTGVSKYPDQSPYKDMIYRQTIAARYGIRLSINAKGYWEPNLIPNWDGSTEPVLPAPPPTPLYQIMKDRFTGEVA